jgi:regulator of sigma E protease
MGALQDTTYFLIFLGVLVTVHESGHFFAAKWAGVKVVKFSIGFGPRLFSVVRGETEYQIAALPLGGFVQMAGMYPGEELDEADEKRSFLNAPWWKRMIILSAGPAFNLIFPIIAYFIALSGDHTLISSRVGAVEPNSPAAIAGVLPGDVITSVDGKIVRAFDEISPALANVYERVVPVTVKRDGQDLTLQITPKKVVENNQVEKITKGLLGVSPIARPAIIGVPPDSFALEHGLESFDRILSINGVIVRDELQLGRVIDAAQNPLTIVVVRSQVKSVGGFDLVSPDTATVTIDKQAGKGLAALGVESADLYVWSVFPESPAQKAGLKQGDRLISFGGDQLLSWYSVRTHLKAAEHAPFELTWRSGSELKHQTLSQAGEEALDELKNKSEVFELGVRPRLGFETFVGGEVLAAGPDYEKLFVHTGPGEALVASFRAVPDAIRTISLIMGKLFTREISLDAVGGPILLFQVASKSAELGLDVFLIRMAMISVNLGLVNLLPIPILDGFGLLAAAWEGIRRRPIPPRSREIANLVGFAMLAMLVVRVFYNDISRLLR